MHATPDGTQRFVQAQPEARRANYRQTASHLRVASVGLGTYLGHPDAATDSAYQEPLTQAVALGCNIIDCAIHYRLQRSERAVGPWLVKELAPGAVPRP